MVHDHPDLERLQGPDRRRPGLGAVAAVLAIATTAFLAVLWPRGDLNADLSLLGVTSEVYRATITDVIEGSCSYDTQTNCLHLVFALEEGPDAGTVTLQEFEDLPSTPTFEIGEPVVLNYIADADPLYRYQYADQERRPLLIIVTLIFAAAAIGLGRLRGLTALAGLAASAAVLLAFIVPAILNGTSPLLVATVGASAIGLLALYLAHGINPQTHVAAIGTFVSLALTVVLSAVVVAAADFSGFSTEESFYLTLTGDVDVRGLLLAGIVLGALGALDDVTVTQASAVWEVQRANPGLSRGDLFHAGLRVGRDHIASAVNTLLLAYAGAAMPLLLLFALSHQPLGIIANSEVLSIEIVRTLVGSIGLVAAVPVTTWLAALTVSREGTSL